MKEYVLKFRSNALGGAFALFKRTFVPAIVLNLIFGIILAVIFFLVLGALGLSFMDFFTSRNEFMRNAASGNPGNSMDMIGMFAGFFFIYMLVFFFIGAWIYNTYLKLNDNEIRENNNSPLSAFTGSLSSRIFSIMGFMLLMGLLTFGVLLGFGVVAMILAFIPFIGALIMIVGYFMVVAFLLRFMLGLPAIVHGNMKVMDSFRFSYSHISWKRAFKILLAIVVIYIVLVLIVLGIMMATVGLPGSNRSTVPEMPGIGTFISFGVVGVVIYAAVLGFGFSALSMLYFRYSEDQSEEGNDVQEHLVGEF